MWDILFFYIIVSRGKKFKKQTGITPKEYRAQTI